MQRQIKNLVTLFAGGVLLAFAVQGLAAAEDPDLERGAREYKLCAGCHGFAGEGNELVGAPSLAGQENWYLSRQLENFRHGIRGGSGDDASGQSMASMASGLSDARRRADLIAYVMKLPEPAHTADGVGGDQNRGASLYAPCAACHGIDGAGNAALQAPGLRAISPWYQVATLQKFKNGSRGAAPQDIYGSQMAPMAAMLADEQAMRDVVAHILTLGQ